MWYEVMCGMWYGKVCEVCGMWDGVGYVGCDVVM